MPKARFGPNRKGWQMTREAILDAIRAVLRDDLNHRHLDGFRPTARLNEDLYLDSVLMLNLFLHLELGHNLAAGEDDITRRPLTTIDDVVDIFDPDVEAVLAQTEFLPATGSVHGETYVDIKVHCFVSCLCEALKRTRGIDHRPFYFGVWDADFAIGDDCVLRYHAPSVSHDAFKTWFERLYGAPLTAWYDETLSKPANIETLIRLVENKASSQFVMVMLDMYHLPERENKFNQNPFPHYLMLEPTNDAAFWHVLDPDFRWQGEIARDTILNAVNQPTVAGGYIFDARDIREPHHADIAAYFEACFKPEENPLLDGLDRIVRAHMDGFEGLEPSGLSKAVAELPIITIRKYAYEHGFAFFWRALILPDAEFQHWCDEIEVLMSGLKTLHFDMLKLAGTGERAVANTILARIALLDRQEKRIKRRLGDVFALWQTSGDLRHPRSDSGAA